MLLFTPKPLEETPQDADLKIVGDRRCLFKGPVLPLWQLIVAGDVSLDQDKDCVSYIREETELVLVPVCLFFLLILGILVHCVKFDGFCALLI